MPRKPRRNQKRTSAPQAHNSAAEDLRLALSELGKREAERKKRGKRRGKQRHVDDYRELRLDGADATDLSAALLEVTASSYAQRKRLMDDETSRVALPGSKGKPGLSRAQIERETGKAAEDVRQQMKKRGARDREHYYRSGERSQAGEVDRTYELESPSED